MNSAHPKHLQKIVDQFCTRLGFPDEKRNGADFDEKLISALYVLWQTLARVCGGASLKRFLEENPRSTAKQVDAFVASWAGKTASIQDEFTWLAAKMVKVGLQVEAKPPRG